MESKIFYGIAFDVVTACMFFTLMVSLKRTWGKKRGRPGAYLVKKSKKNIEFIHNGADAALNKIKNCCSSVADCDVSFLLFQQLNGKYQKELAEN